MCALPFIFTNFPAGNLLNACDRQATNTRLVALATTVNLFANFLLIPPFGAVGAAISSLIGSVVLAVANAIAVHRVVAFRIRALLDVWLRSLVACVVMGAVVVACARLPLVVTAAVGAITYVVAAFACRVVRRKDVGQLRQYFRKVPIAPAAIEATAV